MLDSPFFRLVRQIDGGLCLHRQFEKASMCFYMRRASTRDNTVALTRPDVLSSYEISQQLLIDEPAEKLTRARGACLTPLF